MMTASDHSFTNEVDHQSYRRKKPKVEWCQVIDKVYVRCFICGKPLKKGSHVLRIATSDATFVYQEKRCLDKLMQSAPFDMYDQIKADLEAGKGFNWNG